jgi:hypothetical protein
MSGTSLICPFCGSPDIYHLANQGLPSKLITPYHCPGCHRKFASGPFQPANAPGVMSLKVPYGAGTLAVEIRVTGERLKK